MANWFSKIFYSVEDNKRSLENPGTPISEETLTGAEATSNAITVNADSILSIPEFWRAIEIKAGIMASLPFAIFKQIDEGQERLPDHPISYLISKKPSELYSAYTFFQTLIMHYELYGNFYAQIRRRRSGEIWALFILEPGQVSVEIKDGKSKRYIVENDSGKQTFYSDQIFHIHKPGLSGHAGADLINIHSQNYKLALANRDYLTEFNANGTFLSGVLEHPGELKANTAKRLRKSWAAVYGGAKKAGKVAVLEEGMKFTKVNATPAEADSEATQRLITASISRITGVPKPLLEDYSNATLNNAEHMAQGFLNYSIRPLAENIESEIWHKLIQEDEKPDHAAQFDMQGLLRPDAKARASYIDTLMKYGIINRDEARQMEGRNPIEDGSGAKFLVPLNMFNPEQQSNDNE